MGALKVDRTDADRTSMRAELTLRCPRCRATFASSIQVDRELFAWISLNQQLERCSACGHVGRYERRDYYFEVPEEQQAAAK